MSDLLQPPSELTSRARLSPARQAVWALILVAPAPTLGVLASMVFVPGTVGQVLFGLAKLWMIAAPIIWRLLIERQPLSLSVPRHGGWRTALITGLAMSGVIIGGYLLLGPALIDLSQVRELAEATGLADPVLYILGMVYWIFVNSLVEEFVYRWFLFKNAEVLTGTRLAMLISALLFTVHHVLALKLQFGWEVTVLGSAGVFVGGLVWSWMYSRFRSIWPGWLSHAIVDVAVFGIGWMILFG